MVSLKNFRHTQASFSDLLPYASLVDDGVLLLKDGSLLAGWYFAGPDSQSSTPCEKNALSAQVSAILTRLGSGWTLNVDAMRLPTTEYPDPSRSFFPDPISAAIDDERREHFQKASGHFESHYALTLTYSPPEAKKTHLLTSTSSFRERWMSTAKVSMGFHIACSDLNPEKIFIVHAGADRSPLSENSEAIGLYALANLLYSSFES